MYISKHFIQAPNYPFTVLNAAELPNSAHTMSPSHGTGQSFSQETDLEERGSRCPRGPGRPWGRPGGRGRTQLPPKASPQASPRAARGAGGAPRGLLWCWGTLAGGFLLPRKGVCPSVELSTPELAFFHWTKCRKRERPGRPGRRGGTRRPFDGHRRPNTFAFNCSGVGARLSASFCIFSSEAEQMAMPSRLLPAKAVPRDPRGRAAPPSSGALSARPLTLQADPPRRPLPPSLRRGSAAARPGRLDPGPAARPRPGPGGFFLSPRGVVYTAGGCDVRDAQPRKITRSSSARSWTLAGLIYLFVPGGRGREWALEVEGPGAGGGSCRGRRGPGRPGRRGGARGRPGAGLGSAPGPATRARGPRRRPSSAQLVPSGGIYCYLLCGGCRPRCGPSSPASACARACVCV